MLRCVLRNCAQVMLGHGFYFILSILEFWHVWVLLTAAKSTYTFISGCGFPLKFTDQTQ